MRVLDLFSGIGGFSLGLERAGMKTVAFCEIEPYARRVLAKHWPEVPCYDDVRTLTADRLSADGVSVDVICGGFPCQDISAAGKGAGIDGPRSGLWSEYARLVRECRPIWVIIENSDRLRSRGADRVLGDLEEAGYTWWAGVVGAAHAGAPHRRSRVFILAHTNSEQYKSCRSAHQWQSTEVVSLGACGQRHGVSEIEICTRRDGVEPGGEFHSDADCVRELQPSRRFPQQRGWPGHSGWWSAEPEVDRVAARVPARVDRLRCLGNAVVPQVVEMFGRAIMAAAA